VRLEVEIKLAKSYGFCFGVKRAIEIAEDSKNATTMGPLIHNREEINRLKENFSVTTAHDMSEIGDEKRVIIRTHGITKDDLEALKNSKKEIIDATFPFVTKPQDIVKQMSEEGYKIIIFGDAEHPEVKGVRSYAKNDALVILDIDEIINIALGPKVAIVSQTTRKVSEFKKIVDFLVERVSEVRVFNTICNATFENQDAVRELSKESDVMVVIGGKNSSNTKQLFSISLDHCADSYLVENENEIQKEWFFDKKECGITAGASTPDWIIQKVISKIREFTI
jgi:4-hydroxy-3-methylbut-2-enyl diphosphate reductase